MSDRTGPMKCYMCGKFISGKRFEELAAERRCYEDGAEFLCESCSHEEKDKQERPRASCEKYGWR